MGLLDRACAVEASVESALLWLTSTRELTVSAKVLGELFALVVYGQLILENVKIYEMDNALVDQIFDFMVRDFSKFALELYSKPSSTAVQMEFCQHMIRKPVVDDARYQLVWQEHVYSLKDVYEMNP